MIVNRLYAFFMAYWKFLYVNLIETWHHLLFPDIAWLLSSVLHLSPLFLLQNASLISSISNSQTGQYLSLDGRLCPNWTGPKELLCHRLHGTNHCHGGYKPSSLACLVLDFVWFCEVFQSLTIWCCIDDCSSWYKFNQKNSFFFSKNLYMGER